MGKVLLLLLILFSSADTAAEEILHGPPPEEFPGPGKCAACHGVENIFLELVTGPHKALKCTDCHIPGKVQKGLNDPSFSRLGFYQPGKGWIVFSDTNIACVRCHKKQVYSFCSKACISCHMQEQEILDKVIFVKDKTKKNSPDNIREIKRFRHVPHDLKMD